MKLRLLNLHVREVVERSSLVHRQRGPCNANNISAFIGFLSRQLVQVATRKKMHARTHVRTRAKGDKKGGRRVDLIPHDQFHLNI